MRLLLLGTTLLGGCSFIFNPDHINRDIDAHLQDGADAGLDAHVTLDADPTMLTLLNVAPSVVYEGQGAPNSNSRPVLVVIGGRNITDSFNLDVATTPANNPDIIVGTAQRSHSGDYIVVPISMKVSATATGSVPLTFTVREAGAPTQTIGGVSLTYLPELHGANADFKGPITLTLPLADRYSEVIGGAVTIAGDKTKPVIIHSMSSITLGSLSADGSAGGQSSAAGAAGPGGCGGGAQGAVGGCALGGGSTTASGGGGGGGGYGSVGLQNSAGGGVAHGNPQIVSYAGTLGDGTDVNQSSGGAGGTISAGLFTSAGAGGGGGGTVELAANGDITITGVSANGGTGGAAQSVAVVGGAAGGGGGGSGGVVVLRSSSGTISASSVTANFGMGGALGGIGTNGGNGGVGRVRLDTPQATPPTSTPPAHRVLSFASDTTTTTNLLKPMLHVYGQTNDIVDFYAIDGAGADHNGEPMNVTLTASDMMIQPTLLDGYNRLCATFHPGVRHDALAETCIEIVYLPD